MTSMKYRRPSPNGVCLSCGHKFMPQRNGTCAVCAADPNGNMTGLKILVGSILVTTILGLTYLVTGLLTTMNEPRVRTLSFKETQCETIPVDEFRRRRVQTTCAMRSGGNPFDATKVCLLWNHAEVDEQKFVTSCQREAWRRK